MPIDNQAALRRISAYLRANMVRSNASRLTPFTVVIDDTSAEPCRNYAMPDDHAEADPASIMALICLFKARRRTLRFEYVHELAPDLLLYLQWEGFKSKPAAQLMAYAEPSRPKLQDVPDTEWLLARSPEDFTTAASLHRRTDGTTEISDGDVEQLQQVVKDGGAVALVRSRQTGQGLATGLLRPPSNGVTEIAAIGMSETARQHGMKPALAAFLTWHAIDTGIELPFLMAASDEEARLYGGAGFQKVGTMVHGAR